MVNVNEDLKFCENAKKRKIEGVPFWGSGWISEVFVKIKKTEDQWSCKRSPDILAK